MSLKRLIREQQLIRSGVVDAEMTLPGEPMIYSVKIDVASRARPANYFRNVNWGNMVKAFFRKHLSLHTPTVLIIRFFVSPPGWVPISPSKLRAEKTPAVRSFELCEYLLSFMEVLHTKVIGSYRQFVKIDMEKYYSSNPRTVFKFMKWEHYEKIYNHGTGNAAAAGGSKVQPMDEVQPVQTWPRKNSNARNKGVRRKAEGPTDEGSAHGGVTFSAPRRPRVKQAEAAGRGQDIPHGTP